MNYKYKVSVAVVSFLCLIGLNKFAGAAEYEGSIELGATQVGIDNPSSKFMEYRGVKGNGTYLVGDADLSYTDKSFYLDLTGRGLGLDTREILLESGKYGRYRFYIDYDQIPHFISNNSKTLFAGAGSSNLTIPGYTRIAADTTVSAIVNQIGVGNLRDVDLKLDRATTSTGFSMTSLKGLIEFNLNFKRTELDGVKSIGTVVQDVAQAQGGPRDSIALPEPVDYTTDELKASVAYTRNKAQMELEYYLSSFNNSNESLTWQNPYWNGAASPVISLPPDNRYHRLSLTGGVTLPLATRINMTAEYGKMTQDQNYLSYHAANPVPVTDPRTSPDAAIESKLLNVNVSSRPVSGLGLNARYRHYDTLNLTPVALYRYPMADAQTGAVAPAPQPGPASSDARYNDPYDSIQDLGKFDASYLIARNTTLSAGYDRDVITRSHREVSTTTEDTYRTGIRSNISFASLGGNYQKGLRRGNGYDGTANIESYTTDYINTLTVTGANQRSWINLPALRKYDIADRDRERYGAFVSASPIDIATIGLNYSHGKDEFGDTLVGLNDNRNDTYTVDLSITPTDTITVYSFYTNDRMETKQAGRAIKAGGPTTSLTATNKQAYDWAQNTDDKTDTLGAGLTFQFLKGRLTINPDYTYCKSVTSIGVTGGSGLSATIKPMPDLETERHTVTVSTKYMLTKNVTLGAKYLFERYSSSDWATDGMTYNDTTTLPSNLIPLSGRSPDYTANVGTITLAYKW